MYPTPGSKWRRSAAICAGCGSARDRSPHGYARVRAMKIVERPYAEGDRRRLLEAGLRPVLARVLAGRSVRSAAELDYGPTRLLAPMLLKNLGEAARMLADAIAARKRLLIIADYDADGATA